MRLTIFLVAIFAIFSFTNSVPVDDKEIVNNAPDETLEVIVPQRARCNSTRCALDCWLANWRTGNCDGSTCRCHN
ncbi:unnamed protein product [Chironomus riparius]|uniref:Defensin n=1 Tax=Chironomus riparius TaxID=315576 RepID=A0A9N9S6C6_9DIPT|nr:unnamed protein product [Chironomus riparius]